MHKTVLVVVAAIAAAFGLVIVAAHLQADDNSNHPPASDNRLFSQLIAQNYTVVSRKSYYGGNAGREVTDIRWERSAAPEVIILTDDTSAKAGDFTINVITFTGIDGNGNLDCQPKWGDKSDLTTLIDDAEKVRVAVRNGTAKPAGQFPHGGEHVGCLL